MRIKSLFVFAVVVAIGVIAASPAQASIVLTKVSYAHAFTFANPYATCSSTDLINGMAGTVSGGALKTYVGTPAEARLTDGATISASVVDNDSFRNYSVQNDSNDVSVIYTLAAACYITQIDVYGGYEAGGDWSMGYHHYNIYYSTDGGSTFTQLPATEYDPFTLNWGPGGSDPTVTKVSITDTTGTLASNVDAIKINFNYTGTRCYEIDVLGSVVPEPATMALMALGGFGLLLKRRRSK